MQRKSIERKSIERLTEIVLGEAVVKLLDNNDRINVASVSSRLRAMATEEFNPDRLEAIKLAITELQMQAAVREDREKSLATMGMATPSRAGKKH